MIIYCAIRLDDVSKIIIDGMYRNYIRNLVWDPFTKFRTYGDHITLKFKVTDDYLWEYGMFPLGKTVKIHPYAILVDRFGCSALYFERTELIREQIPFDGKYVHTSICSPEYIPPVHCGTIPERDCDCIPLPPIELSGKVELFTSDGWVS